MNMNNLDLEEDLEEEEIEEGMTEKQAQRLVEWLTTHGHSIQEACRALAYVVGAYESPEEDS
ncbi:MAG: hypothetical protein LUI14_05990 [Lachnospiraceae bacterium]|nr:hypothetical protein [Lachnospiraceae bacterium]